MKIHIYNENGITAKYVDSYHRDLLEPNLYHFYSKNKTFTLNKTQFNFLDYGDKKGSTKEGK